MTDAKPATDQTKTDKAKAVRPPLKFIDKFFMAFMGLFFIAGIVVFSTLFVPDFMRRGMQEDLAEGGGTLAPAQIVAVAETGRWYAKRPILHISAQVAPAGAAGFATQFDQEVGCCSWGNFAPVRKFGCATILPS